jgi:hypothetical protein
MRANHPFSGGYRKVSGRAVKNPQPQSQCPSCGHLLDLVLPECRHCGYELEDTTATVADAEVSKGRRGPFIPYGLVITLVVYGALVKVFLDHQYYESAPFQAALKIHEVQQLLGRDDGRTATRDSLLQALDLTLQAANLMPEDSWGLRRAETIAARMAERSIDVPQESRRRMEFLGARERELAQGRASELNLTARDLWNVDAVLEAPALALKVAAILGVVIALCWGYVYYQGRLARQALGDKATKQTKRELRQLSAHRRGFRR